VIDHLLTKDITIVGKGTYKGSLQQRGIGSEVESKGDFSVTDWQLFLLPKTPLTDKDRVQTADGEEYEVVGRPWSVQDELTRSISHVEANLKVAGTSDPAGTRPSDEEF